MTRRSLELDETLYEILKNRKILTGKSISAQVREAIELYLKEKPKPEKFKVPKHLEPVFTIFDLVAAKLETPKSVVFLPYDDLLILVGEKWQQRDTLHKFCRLLRATNLEAKWSEHYRVEPHPYKPVEVHVFDGYNIYFGSSSQPRACSSGQLYDKKEVILGRLRRGERLIKY